jgi:hypothetical protein
MLYKFYFAALFIIALLVIMIETSKAKPLNETGPIQIGSKNLVLIDM